MGKNRLTNLFVVLLSVSASIFLLTCNVGLGTRVDTKPPTVSIDTLAINSVHKGTFAIGGASVDETAMGGVTVTLAGTTAAGAAASFGPYAATLNEGKTAWTVNLNNKTDAGYEIPDGTYKVSVVATDAAGRSSQADSAVTIDNTAPTVLATSPLTYGPNNQPTFFQSIDIKGEVYDATSIANVIVQVISSDGTVCASKTADGTNTWSVRFKGEDFKTTPAVDGATYYFNIIATDAGGNQNAYFYHRSDIYQLLDTSAGFVSFPAMYDFGRLDQLGSNKNAADVGLTAAELATVRHGSVASAAQKYPDFLYSTTAPTDIKWLNIPESTSVVGIGVPIVGTIMPPVDGSSVDRASVRVRIAKQSDPTNKILQTKVITTVVGSSLNFEVIPADKEGKALPSGNYIIWIDFVTNSKMIGGDDAEFGVSSGVPYFKAANGSDYKLYDQVFINASANIEGIAYLADGSPFIPSATNTLTYKIGDVGTAGPIASDAGGKFSIKVEAPADHTKDGTYLYVLTAKSGTMSTSVSRSYVVDTTSPEINASNLDISKTTQIDDASFVISGTTKDSSGISTVEYTLNGGAEWKSFSTDPFWKFNVSAFPALKDGDTVQIGFRATDIAGNLSAPKYYSLILDLSPPQADFTASSPFTPIGGFDSTKDAFTLGGKMDDAVKTAGRHAASATLTYTKNGVAAGSVTLDPVNNLSWSWSSSSVGLTDGAHDGIYVFTLTVTDSAGKTATASRTIRIDAAAPIVTIERPSPGEVSSTAAYTISGTALDTGGVGFAGVASDTQYSFDGATWIDLGSLSSSINWSKASLDFGSTQGVKKIYVRARDALGNLSPAKDVTFYYDMAPPDLTEDIGTADTVFRPDTFSFSGKWTESNSLTNIKISYTLDGGSSQDLTTISSGASGTAIPWSYTKPTPYADGTYVFTITATDAANRSTTLTRNVKIDNTPPVITPTVSAVYYDGTATISGSASDAVSGVKKVQYSINGTDWFDCDNTTGWSKSFDSSAFAEGDTTISVRAQDNSLLYSTVKPVVVHIDHAAPRATIKTDAEVLGGSPIETASTAVVQSKADVKLVGVADDAAITAGRTATIYLDKSKDGGASIPITDYTLGTGWSWTLKAFSDTATNAGSFKTGKNYKIATVGTTDYIALGASSNTVGACFIATGAGTGDGTAYESNDGLYQFTLKVTDVAGRITTATRTVIIDTTAPIISISTPAPGEQFTTNSVNISGTSRDTGGVGFAGATTDAQYSTDNATWTDLGSLTASINWSASNVSLSAGEGPKFLYVRSTDSLGNQAVKSVTFYYDLNPPEITEAIGTTDPVFKSADYKLSGTWKETNELKDIVVSCNFTNSLGATSAKPTVTIAANTAGTGGVNKTVGAAAANWETPNIAVNSDHSDDGSYAYTIVATDIANRTSTLTRSVKVDTTAPTLSVTAPANPYYDTSVTVTGTANDPGTGASGVAKVLYSTDGGLTWPVGNTCVGTTTWTQSFDLSSVAEGNYTVLFKAVDNGGRESAPQSVSVLVDKAAPRATIDLPAEVQDISGEKFAKTAFTLSGQMDDAGVTAGKKATLATLSYKKDGGSAVDIPVDPTAATTWSWTAPASLFDGSNDGEYAFTLTVKDNVTPPRTTTKTATIKIDTKAPILTITDPTASPAQTLQNALYGANYTYRGKANDPDVAAAKNGAGVKFLYYRIDKTLVASGAYTQMSAGNGNWNISNVFNTDGSGTDSDTNRAEGQWYLHAYAEDSLGNVSPASAATVAFDIDQAKPVLSETLVTTKTVGTTADTRYTKENTIAFGGKWTETNKLTSIKITYKKDGGADTDFTELTPNAAGTDVVWTTGDADISALLNGTYVFKIVATDVATKTSSEITRTVIIDRAPPTVAPAAMGAAWYDGTVAISGTALDDNLASVEFRFKDSAGTYSSWATAAGTATWTGSLNLSAAAEGSGTLYARAWDKAGNSSVEQTVSFIIDRAEPNVTETLHTAALVKSNTDVSFSGVADDDDIGRSDAGIPFRAAAAATATYTKDGGSATSLTSFSWTAGTGVWSATLPATTSGIKADAFVVGTTYTIESVGSTDFTLFGAASNAVGVSFIATRAATAAEVGTDTATRHNDGMYTVTVLVTDIVGRTKSVTRSVQIDTIAPTITVTKPAVGESSTTQSWSISGTANDSGGVGFAGTADVTYEIKNAPSALHGANAVVSSGSINLSGTINWNASVDLGASEDPKVLTVTAKDALGNSATKTVSFNFDKADPELLETTVGTSDTQYANATKTIVFGGTASDTNALASLKVNGTDVPVAGDTSWSYTFDASAKAESNYVLSFVATDAAGKTKILTRNVMVDKTAPAAPTVTTDLSGWQTFASVPLSGTAGDTSGTYKSGIELVQYSLTGGAADWHDLSGTSTWSGTVTLPAGAANNVYFRAKDKAGNYSSPVAPSVVKVDLADPTLAITAPDPATTKITNASSSLAVTITNADATSGVAKAQAKIDSNDFSSGTILETTVSSSPANLAAIDLSAAAVGAHTIYVRVLDNAGRGSVPLPLNVFIDKTKPTGNVTSHADGATVNKTISLAGTASDPNLSTTTGTFKVWKPTAPGTATAATVGAWEAALSGTPSETTSWTVTGFDTTAYAIGSYDASSAAGFQLRVAYVASDLAGNEFYIERVLLVDQNSDKPIVKLTNLETTGTPTLKQTKDVYGTLTDDDGLILDNGTTDGNFYVSTDGGTTWTEVKLEGQSFKFTVSGADGAKSLCFKIKDLAGQTFTTAASASLTTPRLYQAADTYLETPLAFNLDTIPPEIGSDSIGIKAGGATAFSAYSSTNAYYGGTATGSLNVQFMASSANTVKTAIVDAVTITDSVGTSIKRNVTLAAPVTVTVDKDADSFTATGLSPAVGTRVYFVSATSSGLPAGITTNVPYYVIADGRTADTFKVSDTAAGTTPLDITTNGTSVSFTTGWTTDSALSLTTLASGAATLSITATDTPGLSSTTSKTILIDNDAPAIAVTSHTMNEQVTGNVIFNGTSNDGTGSGVVAVKYHVGKCADVNALAAGDWTTLSSQLSWAINFTSAANNIITTTGTYAKALYADETAPGSNIWKLPIYLRATDKAGNIKDYTFVLNVDPDGDKPVVSVSYPADNTTLGGNIRVFGSATDNVSVASVWMAIDTDNDGDYDAADAAALAAVMNGGTHVYGADAASLANGFKVDGSASWSRTINTQGEFNAADTIIPATDIKPGVRYRIKSFGATPTDFLALGATADTNKVDGEFTANSATPSGNGTVVALTRFVKFSVRACDNGGTYGAWSDFRTIKIDNKAPKIGSSKQLRLVKYTNDDVAQPIIAEQAYVSDMYIRGIWYLEGSVEDESGIKGISVSGSGTGSLANDGTSVTSSPSSWFVQDGAAIGSYYNYRVRIPVGKAVTDTTCGNQAYTIYVEDASDPKGTTSQTISINYDNKAPTMDALQHGGSNISSTNLIVESNGAYVLSSKAHEASTGDSGFSRLVFFFVRDGSTKRVYNPMLPIDGSYVPANVKGNRTDLANLTWNTGDVPYLTVTGVDRSGGEDTLKSAALYDNNNIRVGGLVRIAGVDRLIRSVTNSAGAMTVTFSPSVATTYTEASFLYGLVVDNTIKESGTTLGAMTNDDGDKMVESVEKSGGDYTWDAAIKSINIPDGPISLHYVAYDKAGNSISGSVASSVANSRPRIAKVIVGTDLSGDGAFSSAELVTAYSAISGSETPDADVLDKTFKMKGDLVVIPELVSGTGNGMLSYVWAPNADGVSPWDGSTYPTAKNLAPKPTVDVSGDTFTTTASHGLAAGDRVYFTGTVMPGNISANTAYYVIAVGLTDTAFKVSATQGGAAIDITSAGTNVAFTTAFTSITTTDTTVTYPRAIKMSSSLAAIASMDDKLKLFSYTIWDSTDETTSGYDSQWALVNVPVNVDVVDSVAPTAAITPFFWNSATDNSIFGNSKANGHIEITGVLDGTDPDVSGQISIRGSASDDRRLASLWVSIANGTATRFTLSGAGATKTIGSRTYYRVATYNSGTGTWTGTDQWAASGWKFTVTPVSLTQAGHSVTWQLDLDSAKVSGVAALNNDVRVNAEDAKPTTPNASAEESTQTATGALTSYYSMDVVPYITELSRAATFSTLRSRLGYYSFRRTESLIGRGFNLYNSTSDTVTFTGAAALSLTATNTASKFTVTVPAAATSGTLTVKVNGVESQNNANDNSLASNKESTAIDGTALWTDDRRLHIWQSDDNQTGSNRGYFTGSIDPEYPAMTIDGSGVLYGSWSNYATSSVNYVGNNANFVLATNQVARSYDPLEQTDIAFGNRAGVILNANTYGNGLWNYAGAGGVIVWDANADGGNSLSYGNGYEVEFLYHDRRLMQFTGERVAYQGDNIHVAYFDTETKALKYWYTASGNNPAYSARWINIDGGYDAHDGAYQEVFGINEDVTGGATITNIYVTQGASVTANQNIMRDSNGNTYKAPVAGIVDIPISVGTRISGTNTNNSSSVLFAIRTSTNRIVDYSGSSRSTAAGEYCAIDVTPTTNYPVIAYYDITNKTVKLARAKAVNPGATDWTLQTVMAADDPNLLYSGKYVSMKIDSDGYIHMVFFRNSTGDLIYLKSTNNPTNGTTAYTFGPSVTIDTAGSVGIWADISVKTVAGANNDLPYISYLDSSLTNTFDAVKMAYYNPSFETVDGDTAGQPDTIDGWEYMNAALNFEVESVRTSIENDTGTNFWSQAIGYSSPDYFRIGYYVE